MPRYAETIAALATPVGTAALAVLRVSGLDTLRIATDLMGRPPLPRRARHCDYRDRSGTLIDDVLMIYFPGPGSYTGEDALEISSHGNPLIAQKILADLYARGCRPAEPGEFTRRAFLNGRMDLSQAEAVLDVIHARSERALAAANQQLRGSLARRMSQLVDRLLNLLARIEAYIDFPDEDLPTEDRVFIAAELDRLAAETGRLLATSRYGSLLRDGMKIVIVGEPNVGKSSLLNRLVGRERALVSPEPGTTRDFIEERIMVGTHCCRLIDTAGINPFPAPLEEMGMAMTRERLEEADLVLLVLDASRNDQPITPELRALSRRRNCVIIMNKSDLRDNEFASKGVKLDGKSPLSVSALLGHGVENLLKTIEGYADEFQEISGEEVIAVNSRHTEALREACGGLLRSHEDFSGGMPSELLAAELRLVVRSFGEILGRVDNEEVLDRLFATFCIGK